MTIIVNTILDSINSAPLHSDKLSTEMAQWLSNLVDNLNYNLYLLQNFVNQPQAASLTSAQIATVSTDWPDGVLFYDTDLNLYVGKQAGVLVKFTTAAYP